MTLPLLCRQAGYWVPITTWAFGENSQPCTGWGMRENVTLRGEKNRDSDSPKAQQKDISEELSAPVTSAVEL